MANIDAPRGLVLRGKMGGGPISIRRYYIPSTDSTATFIGDPVKSAGGGAADGISTVAQAAATDALLGVVVGVDQFTGVSDANLNLYRKHRPASIGMYVYVCDDPMAIYEVQADDDSATLAAADMQLNVNIIVGSGDTVTGLSGVELDTDTKNTTATLPLKIIGISQSSGNEPYVANQNVLVKINNHQFGSHTGTLAI